MIEKRTWLQGAVIYQIYPRSFSDAKGTGVGNLQGIIDKLDYLGGTTDSLGVTAVWISPIYTSPMADFGYDVADYTNVDPIFGDLHDIEVLIAAAHERNIKVILDFVPNHTSAEHPWFIESRSSLDNPKRDWYNWHTAPADGNPPNNWLSVFGGSAWELSEETGEYYLHSFLAQQPDLNWENPAVREAMKSAMCFWLDMGVDGLRMDAVDWLSKDTELRDDPVDDFAINKTAGHDHESLRHIFSRDGPRLYERLDELSSVMSEYTDRFMITEAHPETSDRVAGYLRYYEGVNPYLSAPFNLEGIYLPWDAMTFRSFVDSFQSAMKSDYLPIYTLGNHDESRVGSRIGLAAARVAAMMLLTLPGAIFVYYGEEIGMMDVAMSGKDLRDPFLGLKHGRDPERTPMQWDESVHTGFSTATPWLPIAADYGRVNVAAESKDSKSMLSLYKRLIALRKSSEPLMHSDYESIPSQESVFAYKRFYDDKELVVILNFSGATEEVSLPGMQGTLILSTHLDNEGASVGEQLKLRPNEGVIVRVHND